MFGPSDKEGAGCLSGEWNARPARGAQWERESRCAVAWWRISCFSFLARFGLKTDPPQCLVRCVRETVRVRCICGMYQSQSLIVGSCARVCVSRQ